jgi:predicted neutral ceramidase superfamily lipid hydrolase
MPSLNYPRIFIIIGTPIFSIMLDAIIIIGMEIMIRRIYTLNIIKSTSVIFAVILAIFFLSGQSPNPLSLANRPLAIGLASSMIFFNALVIGISLWMRRLEGMMEQFRVIPLILKPKISWFCLNRLKTPYVYWKNVIVILENPSKTLVVDVSEDQLSTYRPLRR